MHRQNDTHSHVMDRIRSQMPDKPDSSSLERVRTTALERTAQRRGVAGLRHPWRTLGGVTAIAAVVVALMIALPTSHSDPAFASDLAAEALMLQTDGEVLHIVATYTRTSENDAEGHDPRLDLDQEWSYWVDTTDQRMRFESVNRTDGSLDSAQVQIQDTVVGFQNNIRYGTGDMQQLVEWTTADTPLASVMNGNVEFLRAKIADGSAKATSTEIIDGEEYWVVEYRPPLENILTRCVLVAKLRKSDYRIKDWTLERGYLNLDGKGSEISSMTFSTIEYIDPSTLPDDFFTFESVIALAEPGTPVDKR